MDGIKKTHFDEEDFVKKNKTIIFPTATLKMHRSAAGVTYQ